MSKLEKLGNLIGRLNRIGGGIAEISRLLGNISEEVSSINADKVDFEYLEEDISAIQHEIKAQGYQVLATYLTLKDEAIKKLIEITVFYEKDEKYFKRISRNEANEVINLPADVRNELDLNRTVELKIS